MTRAVEETRAGADAGAAADTGASVEPRAGARRGGRVRLPDALSEDAAALARALETRACT